MCKDVDEDGCKVCKNTIRVREDVRRANGSVGPEWNSTVRTVNCRILFSPLLVACHSGVGCALLCTVPQSHWSQRSREASVRHRLALDSFPQFRVHFGSPAFSKCRARNEVRRGIGIQKPIWKQEKVQPRSAADWRSSPRSVFGELTGHSTVSSTAHRSTTQINRSAKLLFAQKDKPTHAHALVTRLSSQTALRARTDTSLSSSVSSPHITQAPTTSSRTKSQPFIWLLDSVSNQLPRQNDDPHTNGPAVRAYPQ